MSKTSLFDLGPEKLNRLLSIGKKGQDASSDPEAEPSVSTSEAQKLMEELDSWIGRYKLIRMLGEGGMGVVYLAEQEHPIKRQVALKIIKLGMDTKRVIARFEAERQALALLDHPNIAHVHDAGTTESGRPFFVMEHVDGLPITGHCDQHRLTIEERLDLFRQICLAVHHAHQKGIIHRDIKPSNILVAMRDGVAIPKIIDFGIAKAIARPLTDRPLETEQGQLFGTPEYMSPEQADAANEDIDTRSDVYSLGVLLYVLLTGCLPFESDTLREGGIEHIRKAIRETDPRTPSTRLIRLGERATAIAENRRMEIQTLAKHLRKELEWIPLKAMRKERSQRYRSASELADDIENYLVGNPLIAGHPTAGYRLRKFLGRHKALVGGVAAVLIVSVIGTIVSVMFAIGQARARAEFQAIAGFLQSDILGSINESRVSGGEDSLRYLLDSAVEKIELKFKDQSRIRASLYGTLSSTYGFGLGEYRLGLLYAEREYHIYREELGENFDTNWLALAYARMGKYKEAESLFLKRFKTGSPFQANGEIWPDVGSFFNCNLAGLYYKQGRYSEAEQLFSQTLALAQWDSEDEWRLYYTGRLAQVLRGQGHDEKAKGLFETILRAQRQVLPAEHIHIMGTMKNLAEVYTDQGNPEDAEDLLVESLESMRRIWGTGHPETLAFTNSLAVLRTKQGRYEEAEHLFKEALEGRSDKLDEDHPATLETKNDLAALYKEQARYEEAEKLLLEAVEGRGLKLGDTHPHTQESVKTLIELYEACNKPEEARKWRPKLSGRAYSEQRC
ncbi:MAG: protein kinase domain-containing protein [Planctomycetota bacterium]|jgi:serine/threonine protein kinase